MGPATRNTLWRNTASRKKIFDFELNQTEKPACLTKQSLLIPQDYYRAKLQHLMWLVYLIPTHCFTRMPSSGNLFQIKFETYSVFRSNRTFDTLMWEKQTRPVNCLCSNLFSFHATYFALLSNKMRAVCGIVDNTKSVNNVAYKSFVKSISVNKPSSVPTVQTPKIFLYE